MKNSTKVLLVTLVSVTAVVGLAYLFKKDEALPEELQELAETVTEQFK